METQVKISPATIGSKVETTVELVKRLCLAESISRIYSVDHPKGRAAVQGAFDWLTAVLAQHGNVTISMAEGKVLVDGLPVDERNPTVARFAAAFQQIHVDNLQFMPGLTLAEFLDFYRLLLQGSKFINAGGGLATLLAQRGIAHVQSQRISYVAVREDEKVVARDAEVVDRRGGTATAEQRELVEYMVNQLMQKAENRQWLITEVKNNPRKMAEAIADGIELAAQRVESGLTPEDTMTGLLENIRLVGQALLEERTGSAASSVDELENAILALETEVRSRSRQLMSSETAVHFINEVLALITHYSDQVRARKISDEILRGERTMKQAEKLLQRLTPQEISVEDFLNKMRGLLLERGVTPDQLMKLAQAARPKPARPRVRRTRRVNKPVAETIAQQLTSRGIDCSQAEAIAADMAALVERELGARAGALKTANEQLTRDLRDLAEVLDQLGLPVIVWNRGGTVLYVHRSAAALAPQIGTALSGDVLAAFSAQQFPLDATAAQAIAARFSPDAAALLSAVDRLIHASDGAPVGALLRLPSN